MASTEFGTNDAQTVKHWSSKLTRETFGQTYFRKFAGTGPGSIIQIHTDLEKSAGDEIRYDLRTQTRDPGVTGDSELKGFESKLTFYQDTMTIGQRRQAHEFRDESQQRTAHDLRTSAKESLGEWWRWVYDGLMFAYLAGTAGDDTENVSSLLGAGGHAGNALQAATNVIDGSAADMTLSVLDAGVELAKTQNPRIEPCIVDGEPKYVAVLHPYSVTSLMIEIGDQAWNMIQQRAGSRGSKNPIYSGALGEYHGIVLHESEFIPRDTATDLTYNLLLGRSAGAFAMGNAYKKRQRAAVGGGGYFRWTEDVDDYGNREGVGSASIYGIKKCRFNSVDYATVNIQTTDASHA